MASNYQIVADLVLNTGDVSKQIDGVQSLVKTGSQVGLTYQEANLILGKTIDIIQSMADEVYTLDAALIEFQKVSDLSGSSLDDYTAKLKELGQEVARTG